MVESEHSCIILAGGEGKRMAGEDKGLVQFNERPLIEHMITIAEQASRDIIISANRHLDQYRQYGYPVIPDSTPAQNLAYRGPMAGIAACLPHCRYDTSFVVPCDTPCLSPGWLYELERKKTRSIAIIEHNSRLQLVMLMNTDLLSSLKKALDNNQRALMQWAMAIEHDIVTVELDRHFTNLNTHDDLTV